MKKRSASCLRSVVSKHKHISRTTEYKMLIRKHIWNEFKCKQRMLDLKSKEHQVFFFFRGKKSLAFNGACKVDVIHDIQKLQFFKPLR